MASMTGTRTFLTPTLRVRPLPGDIGHLGSCPLCAHGKGMPPCLACRDELRSRLVEWGGAN